MLIMTTTNYKAYQNECLNSAKLKAEVTTLNQEKAEAQRGIQELNDKLKEETRFELSLQIELEDVTKEKEELSSSLAQTTEQLNHASEEKAQLEGELKELQVRLEEEKELLSKVAGRDESLIKALEGKFDELTRMIDTKLANGPSTGAISPDSPELTEPPKGKILFVDKKNDLVVVNIGGEDGVKPDDLFRMHNGGNYKGKVKISRVNKTKSTGYIIEKSPGAEVSEGDEVE